MGVIDNPLPTVFGSEDMAEGVSQKEKDGRHRRGRGVDIVDRNKEINRRVIVSE